MRDRVARVTVVLAGERHITWAINGHPTAHRLIAGQAIAVAPSGWTQPRSQHPHRYLSIDAYPGFTRFMCESARGEPNQPGAGVIYADGPQPAPARGLLQAALALIDTGDNTRLTRVLSCYIDEVLYGCRITSRADAGLATWQHAAAWAHDHCSPDMGRDAIADAIGIHPNHLSRLCQRCTGGTLLDYLTALRIDRAKRLLSDGTLSMAAVIDGAGYRDPTHFRKRFSHVVGLTPYEWRKRQLAQNPSTHLLVTTEPSGEPT